MHAMRLDAVGSTLKWTEFPDRMPGPGQIRITVCELQRTDLNRLEEAPRIVLRPGFRHR